MATNVIQKIDNLIKYVRDNVGDDSKSEPCPSTAPCVDSNTYTPIGVTKTLQAIRGSKSQLSDLKVYYSSDFNSKQGIKNAVVMLYDIFGWNAKNKNVFEFCDRLFNQGNGDYVVIMPDFYRDNPWPVNKEITMDEIMKWKDKTATYDIVLDDMTNRILPSLQANGIENICFIGLCWGGNIGFRLGECNNKQIDAKTNQMFAGLISVHGSRITDELCQKMNIPVLYCPTPKDQPVQPVKNILNKKDFGSKCVYKAYDNMFHGFTGGRGDFKNKENKEAFDEVCGLSLNFLKNVFGISSGVVGGMKDADRKELIDAANAVRSGVEKAAGDDEKFEFYEVVSGSKQVVAGMNFEIRVKIGSNKFADMKVYRSLPPFKYELKNVAFVTSEAPKVGGWGKAAEKQELSDAANAVKSQVEKQANDMGKPIKIYEVQEGRKQVVAGMNYKIKIKVDDNRFCEIKVYRSLPPISYELKSIVWTESGGSGGSIVGGSKPADKDELTEAANAVRNEVQQMDDEKYSVYEVVSGTKQVVAGINYQIKVKVGANKFAEIKVYRSLPPFKYELKNVVFVTSETPKLGGWGAVAEKQELSDAANAVKSQVEKQANDMGKQIKMYEVQEGRKQVVAGMNYKIKIKVDDNRFCEVKVYRSLPPVSYELKNVIWIEPSPSRKVGGSKQADKDELSVAANAVKDEVQNMDDEKFTCYDVVSGTKQVVAGMNYQIKVKVGANKVAEIKVYRSLPPFKYELKSAVFVSTETPKLGGWGKAAKKQEMTDAANAVKSQVEKQANDSGRPIKIYEVQEGRKQVVAGMNFKIKIKVDDNRFCEIKVYRSLPPVSYELKNVIWIEPRPSPKVGGFKQADKDELTAAANAVKDEVQNKDDEKFSCYEVVSGTKQVVAGMNYQIKVKVGANKFADIKVFRSLPPIKYELKSVAFVTSEAPKLGGWGAVAEKQELTDAANAVKSQVEKQANDMGKPIKMYEVQEGRKQVVAGMNYKIKIKVDGNRCCEIKVYRSLPPVSYELKNVIWTES